MTNINRRELLQGIAGGAGLSSIGALGAIGTVGASDDWPPSVDILDGSEAVRVLAKMRRTDEYRTLQDELRGRRQAVRFDAGHATVVHAAQLHPDGADVGAVNVAYAPIVGTDDSYLTIGLDAESGAVTVAGLEFIEGDTTELVAVTDRGVASTSLVPGEVEMPPPAGGDFTIQSDLYCYNCQFMVSQLCYYGCGLPIWFLCGLLAIPTGGLGGLACGTFVYAACSLIAAYGCGYAGVAHDICVDMGQCDPEDDDDDDFECWDSWCPE